jgi:sortase B
MFADLSYIYNGVLGNDVEIDIYRSDYRLLTYKVFSTYVYDPESYYLTTRFSDDEAYSTYLSTMLSRSVINFNQNVGVDDTIITLSTCTSDAKRRIVVHAKLISNTEMPR